MRYYNSEWKKTQRREQLRIKDESRKKSIISSLSDSCKYKWVLKSIETSESDRKLIDRTKNKSLRESDSEVKGSNKTLNIPTTSKNNNSSVSEHSSTRGKNVRVNVESENASPAGVMNEKIKHNSQERQIISCNNSLREKLSKISSTDNRNTENNNMPIIKDNKKVKNKECKNMPNINNDIEMGKTQ